MYLGDFGKVIFLTKNREDAKTKKQKVQAEKKIKEFTTEYGNRFKKDGKLKREFESKYLPEGLFGAGVPKRKRYEQKKKSGPKVGVLTGRRAKRTIKGDITKKMNMGGVMKNRGGTFKGVY